LQRPCYHSYPKPIHEMDVEIYIVWHHKIANFYQDTRISCCHGISNTISVTIFWHSFDIPRKRFSIRFTTFLFQITIWKKRSLFCLFFCLWHFLSLFLLLFLLPRHGTSYTYPKRFILKGSRKEILQIYYESSCGNTKYSAKEIFQKFPCPLTLYFELPQVEWKLQYN
jgi:hypothetical protein